MKKARSSSRSRPSWTTPSSAKRVNRSQKSEAGNYKFQISGFRMSKLIIPKVIGHRGAKAYAPENTLASIHAAADLGIEWVEIDVKLTKDGVPVIFHDEELNRCTNGSGLVAETDFKTIGELDAGLWFGDSFLGEKIPTLEEALNVIIDRGLGVNLEIKPCPGREVETAEVMLDHATRIWSDDAPPPLISSFSQVS